MVRKTYRRNGGGYMTPAEFFNPAAQQPSSTAPALTSAPSPGWVRPPMSASNTVSPDSLTSPQKGGWKQTRRLVNKMSGGFSPALMGAFVANAQTAAVPLALYGLYSLVGKKDGAAAPASKPAAPTPKGGRRGTRRGRRSAH